MYVYMYVCMYCMYTGALPDEGRAFEITEIEGGLADRLHRPST